jgi:hypothetical protein
MTRNFTSLHIGRIGSGKSELGNAVLQRTAFVASEDPEAVTLETTAAHSTIDGVHRTVIDTQGLDDQRSVDAEHIRQMVQFLQNCQSGVNVVVLVLNSQSDRLSAGIQELLRMLHVFFNNTQFWYHFCIVFTKCYAEIDIHRDSKRRKSRAMAKSLAIECAGPSVHDISVPVFFVNSTAWQSDGATRHELAALNAFVAGLPALPTQHLVAPNPQWFKVEPETQRGVLLKTVDDRIPNGIRRTLIYGDQRREKRTGYDGETIAYSNWTTMHQWKEVKRQTQVKQSETVIVRVVSTPCGSKKEHDVQVGTRVSTTYEARERIKTTGFGAEVTFSEWKVHGTWMVSQTEFCSMSQSPPISISRSTSDNELMA